jgi:hypothetical protein
MYDKKTICTHEGGHAFAHILMKLPFVNAKVWPVKKDHWGGQTNIRFDYPKITNRSEYNEFMAKMTMSALGGLAAEIAVFKSYDATLEKFVRAKTDLQQAKGYISYMALGGEDEEERFTLSALYHTVKLFENPAHASTLTKIINALEERETLTYDQAIEVIK